MFIHGMTVSHEIFIRFLSFFLSNPKCTHVYKIILLVVVNFSSTYIKLRRRGMEAKLVRGNNLSILEPKVSRLNNRRNQPKGRRNEISTHGFRK